MEKKHVRYACRGVPSLLISRLPVEFSTDVEELDAFCIPIAPRVPHSVINDDALEGGQVAEGRALLGPSKLISAGLEFENEDGVIAISEEKRVFLICDFSDQVMRHLRTYEPPSEDVSKIVPLLESMPDGLPSMVGVMDQVRTWASEADRPRAAFYSAREEPDEKDAGGVCRGKKVTNVTFMEEIEMLKAQLGVIDDGCGKRAERCTPCHSCCRALGRHLVDRPSHPSTFRRNCKWPYSTGRPCSDHWSTTNNPAVCSEGHPEEAALYTTMKEDEPKHLLEAPGEAEPGALA